MYCAHQAWYRDGGAKQKGGAQKKRGRTKKKEGAQKKKGGCTKKKGGRTKKRRAHKKEGAPKRGHTFIQFGKIIQKHFHPKTISSKNVSSQNGFIQISFPLLNPKQHNTLNTLNFGQFYLTAPSPLPRTLLLRTFRRTLLCQTAHLSAPHRGRLHTNTDFFDCPTFVLSFDETVFG